MLTQWNVIWRLDWQGLRFYWWPFFRPVGAFKRWMWTRCPVCGQGFQWRNWPTTDLFEEQIKPQRWFHSEEQIYHSGCYSQMLHRRRRRGELLMRALTQWA